MVIAMLATLAMDILAVYLVTSVPVRKITVTETRRVFLQEWEHLSVE